MKNRSRLKKGLAGAVIAGSAFAAIPGAAMASTSPSFTHAQQLLEQQLTSRVSQLARLSADVSGSKTLTAAHVTTLNAILATDSSNINALVVKVPTDTTKAELNADRASMLRANRVFAVATPQVFLTIGADNVASQVTAFQGDESELQTAVNSLVGQHGYSNALNHYVAFVRAVNSSAAESSGVATSVLAQVPADYPRDTNVFVHDNKVLLSAGIALAHATYDASVIGLASGGYVGS